MHLLPCDECNKKLEEKKAMSKRLEEIALEYGLCNCDEAYTKRNMTSPDCPFHAFAVSEAMCQYAREVSQASLEKAYGKACINLELYSYEYETLEQSINNPDNIVLP